MTNEEVDKLEAGPELDALIAEKVMGWTNVSVKNYPHKKGDRYRHNAEGIPPKGATVLENLFFSAVEAPSGGRYKVPPRFSADIAAAWEVVEKLELIVGPSAIDKWQARQNYDLDAPGVEAFGPTAPLAICRAALKAVGA